MNEGEYSRVSGPGTGVYVLTNERSHFIVSNAYAPEPYILIEGVL